MDYIPTPDLVIPTEFWRDDLDDREVMVSIRCITYNHEKYIRDALESFVNQKTNFRFEAIVHDDCSTDGTAAIIREYAEKYPSIIKPIFEKENQYSKGNGRIGKIMNPHMRGKYVAMCEGDDYWTDPLKLQKQVDFMEKNPEYVLIYSNLSCLHNNQISQPSNEFKEGEILDYLINCSNCIATLTALYRKETYERIPHHFKNKSFGMGDYPLWIELSSMGKVKFINETMACYRILEESASHSQNYKKRIDFLNSSVEIQRFYSKIYNIQLDEHNIFKKYESLYRVSRIHKLKNLEINLLPIIKKFPYNLSFKTQLVILLTSFPFKFFSYPILKKIF